MQNTKEWYFLKIAYRNQIIFERKIKKNEKKLQ